MSFNQKVISESVPGYSSIHSLSVIVIVVFSVLLATTIVSAVSDYFQIELLNRIITGSQFTMSEVDANDDRQALIGITYLIINLVVIIMFLIWFHRAHRNLRALGANDLKYSPGWAVGGFFIPIWNLFRPYQVAQEIWKASEPDCLSSSGSDWKHTKGSALIGWWWALFLITGWVGNFLLRSALGAETTESIQSYSYTLLVSDVLLIPAIVLAIFVVKNIDDRQSQRLRTKALVSNKPGQEAHYLPVKQSSEYEPQLVETEIILESPKVEKASATKVPNYCSNCGSKLTPDSKYCRECGTKIDRDSIQLI